MAQCANCAWTWVDTPGMGVHRPPPRCPECGGRVKLLCPYCKEPYAHQWCGNCERFMDPPPPPENTKIKKGVG